MNKPIVIGALAVAAFVTVIVYVRRDSENQSPATAQSAPGSEPGAAPVAPGPGPGAQPGAAGSASPASNPKPVPPDPRLAALAVSQDNGLIEFVRAADGKVISEIDKDPGSPSFTKPLREYMYAGDKVIGLTAYRYFADHVEINRTRVSYKPDGSVDRMAESTSIDAAKKK